MWADFIDVWRESYLRAIEQTVPEEDRESAYIGLILDKDTAPNLSMVYSQSENLDKSVYCGFSIDRLPSDESLPHVHALVIVRPTPQNLALLREELSSPHFRDYSIYFTTTVPDDDYLQSLAFADLKGSVQRVGNFFLDFSPINDHLFDLGTHTNTLLFDGDKLKDIATRLATVFLSQGRRPIIHFVDRESQGFKLATRLQGIVRSMVAELPPDQLAALRPANLYIVDRAEDPFTPMVINWSFQALVHEFCTINAGRAMHIKDSAEPVPFNWTMEHYRDLAFQNYGNVSDRLSQLCKDKIKYREDASNLRGATLEQYRSYIANMPRVMRLERAVDNHFKVHGALSSSFNERRVFDWSRWQQDMMDPKTLSKSDPKQYAALMKRMLQNATQKVLEVALKNTAIYALRFERSIVKDTSPLEGVLQAMLEAGVNRHQLELITKLFGYASADRRLLCGRDFKLQLPPGVEENNLMRHQPHLTNVMMNATATQPKPMRFETVDHTSEGAPTTARDADACVFILGGVTFAEALTARQISGARSGKLIVGGNTVHNSDSFCRAVMELPPSRELDIGSILGWN